MIITIDGPVASGKSSVAKELSKELGVYYLYTGLLYRAVAYVLLQKIEDGKELDLDKDDSVFVTKFSQQAKTLTPDRLTFIKEIVYDYGKDDGDSRPYIFYQGEDVTKHLYHVLFDQLSSIVSANKYVREALLDLQRDVAKRYDIVADGRDCGTVIFPDADYKFYLTANVDVRAERLMVDEKRRGVEEDIEKVKSELEERDKRDQEREVAPLKIPEGAFIVDNSDLTLEETVARFLRHIPR